MWEKMDGRAMQVGRVPYNVRVNVRIDVQEGTRKGQQMDEPATAP